MDEKELCYYCKEDFEGDRGVFYVDKGGTVGVVRVHKDCQRKFEHGDELNVRIRVMPGRGEPSYGTKFMKGRR